LVASLFQKPNFSERMHGIVQFGFMKAAPEFFLQLFERNKPFFLIEKKADQGIFRLRFPRRVFKRFIHWLFSLGSFRRDRTPLNLRRGNTGPAFMDQRFVNCMQPNG
jgi:hypothetical protein